MNRPNTYGTRTTNQRPASPGQQHSQRSDNPSSSGRDIYMNPFDFVPWYPDGSGAGATPDRAARLPDNPQPQANVRDDWHEIDGPGSRRFTGRLTLQLEVLTPLHVAGRIEAQPGGAMTKRFFYRQGPDNRPCIPASSIKGALRSFVEAATNGWFSAITDDYPKVPKERGRRIIVRSFEPDEPTVLPSAFWVPREFLRHGTDPGAGMIRTVDLASFLFGIVSPDKDRERSTGDEINQAFRGQVQLEDVFFGPKALANQKSLDLDTKAAFGGPKPRLNNFWYFTPSEFQVKSLLGGRLQLLEPIGRWLRGRKFYFHQGTDACHQWYSKSGHWPQSLKEVDTEVVTVGQRSDTFSVHFTDLPESLLAFLVFAFCPPDQVRHKLGALKPFGFGSVQFHAVSLDVEKPGLARLSLRGREAKDELRLPCLSLRGREAKDEQRGEKLGEIPALKFAEAGILHPKAWTWLRHILHFPQAIDAKHRVFVYPPYHQNEKGGPRQPSVAQGFARPLLLNDLERIRSAAPVFQRNPGWQKYGLTTLADVMDLLDSLYRDQQWGKQPIDLTLYQSYAANYEQICADAGLPERDIDRLRTEVERRK